MFSLVYPEGGKLWPELAERADGFNELVSIWSGCRPPIKAHRAGIRRLRLL